MTHYILKPHEVGHRVVLSPTLPSVTLIRLVIQLVATVQVSIYAHFCMGNRRYGITGSCLTPVSPHHNIRVPYKSRPSNLRHKIVQNRLHAAKCEWVPFTITGQRIARRRQHVFLGIMIARRLPWKPQVDNLKSELTSFVQFVRLIKGTTWGTRTVSLLRLRLEPFFYSNLPT